MGKLSFNFPYQTVPQLVISPEEIIKTYLYGIPICNVEGKELTADLIRQKVLNAQQYLENILFIKLTEQIIRESSSFVREEWNVYGFVKTSYQVRIPLRLDGMYNNIKQISYDGKWLSNRKENSSTSGEENSTFFRQIHVIPGSSGGGLYAGAIPLSLLLATNYIPNFWHSIYVTGFSKVPRDIIDMIGKLTAIQLLAVLGDTFNGVGTNSYSLSLDGLSQSISMLKSDKSGIYGSRIFQYTTDLFGTDGKGGMMEALKAKYKGIIWDVC